MRVGRTNEASPPATPAPGPTRTDLSAEVDRAPYADRTASAPERAASHQTQPFWQLLRGLGKELDRGESIADRAIRGGASHASLSPERLIALQAGIYRYSEAVDLATKLVDRGTQAVRTTLQNQ